MMTAAGPTTSQRDEPESSGIATLALGVVPASSIITAKNPEAVTEAGHEKLVYEIQSGDDETGLVPNAAEVSGYRSGTTSNHAEDHSKILVAPMRPARASEFQLLKQWEGTVTEIRSDEFVALLRDLREPDDPTRIEAVFGRDEVVDGDAHLLKEGAVFSWTIGREKSAWGQIKNLDYIRFFRLPAWTRHEVENAERRADELGALFDPERP